MAVTSQAVEATVPYDPLPPLERPKYSTINSEQLLAKHLNGKQDEWTAVAERNKPLNLLDLPVDILQSVLREVTHTNDLTSLALTHSALHNLVIPHIYARFDIVWPEANTHIESRVGVDALTYGLATLVMAQDVFGETQYQPQAPHQCQNCGHQEAHHAQLLRTSRIPRRGNHFAQYTRKFSLGNGPPDWVQEYLITKEGGKMLGTLVALAVGRMRNLETFIWDMPTGVLRDVWLALASLGNRYDGYPCKLERVWVRWHDNQEQGPLASPPPPDTHGLPSHSTLPSLLNSHAHSLFQIPPYPRVEFPTFSILPPLKSLSVLDIDEMPYAEEMSILLERSLHKLRELRVGIAQHAQFDMWARPLEDGTLMPSPLMSVSDSLPRPGGILGILVGGFCDISTNPTSSDSTQAVGSNEQKVEVQELSTPNQEILAALDAADSKDHDRETVANEIDVGQLSAMLQNQTITGEPLPEPPTLTVRKRGDRALLVNDINGSRNLFERGRQTRKLQLDTLELERVYLSINVLSRAIDWTRLTTLTLLGCRNHEILWKELRKRFTPPSRSRISSSPAKSLTASLPGLFLRSRTPSNRSLSSAAPVEEYQLKLQRLHTDAVSPALIAFIKDSLAPDSLEWLFLQEHSSYKSTVTIDMIYKGAVRRHRGSLKKLLIDSEVRAEDETPDSSWKRWVYSRELLSCITSGKMQLRELSMSIDYKDWHFFLQRLPHATKLRSLHISHIAEHVHGTVDSREAALQVLDIVALRPELELCYLGIQGQCFEVLEYSSIQRDAMSSSVEHLLANHSPQDSDDNEEGTEAVHDEDSDLELAVSHGELTEDDEVAETLKKPCFRLREILFYDDKVSIFKARHGRL